MTYPQPLLQQLAVHIFSAIEDAHDGHCLRVDSLDRDDCEYLAGRLDNDLDSVTVGVLDDDPDAPPPAMQPEKAIEARNRKEGVLCLLVPSGTPAPTASSLHNAFAEFDLERALGESVTALLDALDAELAAAIKVVLTRQRGFGAASVEQRASYVAAVAEDPSQERAGGELWRLGLIPDAPGFDTRLDDNRRCTAEISRPRVATTSASQRVQACGVNTDLSSYSRLLEHLQRSPDPLATGRWQCDIAAEPDLLFQDWPLVAAEPSDLKAIAVLPLVDDKGSVDKKSGLKSAETAGALPRAHLGPKAKVSIGWRAEPGTPAAVSGWQVELIPSRHEYGDLTSAIELPVLTVGRTKKRASLKLDLDPDTIENKIAQVSVVALDENGNPVVDADGVVIEGLSQEFILDEEIEDGEDDRVRRSTVVSVPVARVVAAASGRHEDITEDGVSWVDNDEETFFSVTLTGGMEARITSPSTLVATERQMLAATCPTAMRADLDAGDVTDPARQVAQTAPSLDELGPRWRALTAALDAQGTRATIESADWRDEDLRKRARSYVTAWQRDLREADGPEACAALMAAGTLELSVRRGRAERQAVVATGLHPVRLAWFLRYTDLLREWEQAVTDRPPAQRDLDRSLLDRLAPLNTPPFVATVDGVVLLFSRNLGLSHGLYVSPGDVSSSQALIDILRAVGVRTSEGPGGDMPASRLATTIRDYRRSHTYLSSLELAAINPGDGSFLAAAIRDLWAPADEEDEDVLLPVHVQAFDDTATTPRPVLRLQDLNRELALRQPGGRHSFLHPLFSLDVRPVEDLRDHHVGDANLAVISDLLTPKLGLAPKPDRDSGSCDGLLSRHRSSFTSGDEDLRWASTYRFDLAKRSGTSADLAGVQEDSLRAVTTVLGGQPDSETPAIQVVLDADAERKVDRLHDSSDWVVTIDRHLGVEQYDSPRDSHTGRRSQRYILDYAPEFLDGIGHRLAVTTAHREELEQVLARAMDELGFGHVHESVGTVLNHLKLVSGRLALQVLGNESHAKEAVSLGIVVAHLEAEGRLKDTILLPVDAHPEIFGVNARAEDVLARRRCDLLAFRVSDRVLEIELIEVKSRSTGHAPSDLLDRIADQVEATEDLLRTVFFQTEPPRVDHKLQRARLQSLLDFYLDRGRRNGMIDDDAHRKIAERLTKLETSYADFRSVRSGFIVSMDSPAVPPRIHRGVTIETLTAASLGDAGFTSAYPPDAASTGVTADPPEPAGAEVDPSDGRGSSEVLAPNAAEPGGAQADTGREREIDRSPDGSHDAPADRTDEPVQVNGEPDASDSSPDADQLARADDEAVRTDDEPVHPDEPGVERSATIDVELGVIDSTEEPVPWKIGVRGSPHLFILGIPGQGKSWAVNRLLRSFQAQELPALVFDFHGQFATDPHRGEHMRVLDAQEGLPFSPFEPESSPNRWRAQAWEIAEIFEYVCDLGDMQRDVVYEAVAAAYEDATPDGEGMRLPSVADVAAKLAVVESERKIRNVVARTRPMLEFGLFADAPDTDLRTLVQDGLIVDVHGLTLETVQLAAGAFILRKIYKDMVRWGETDRLRLAIVLDEAHKLARDVTLPKIMKEGRKFGLAVIVASQGLADFHQDVTGNAGTKVVFRTNFPASKKVAGLLRGRQGTDLAAQIEQLGVGEAYVQTTEMTLARKVRMHPIDVP